MAKSAKMSETRILLKRGRYLNIMYTKTGTATENTMMWLVKAKAMRYMIKYKYLMLRSLYKTNNMITMNKAVSG